MLDRRVRGQREWGVLGIPRARGVVRVQRDGESGDRPNNRRAKSLGHENVKREHTHVRPKVRERTHKHTCGLLLLLIVIAPCLASVLQLGVHLLRAMDSARGQPMSAFVECARVHLTRPSDSCRALPDTHQSHGTQDTPLKAINARTRKTRQGKTSQGSMMGRAPDSAS